MATLRNDTVIRNADGQATSAIITAANIVNHAAGKLSSSDTRSVVTTPQTINSGTVFDFKQNNTESLSDGGSYFGQMTFRPYGASTDWSGTLSHQLGFTDSGNIWQRSGSSTTWGAWKKILNSSNYSGYALPLSGGTLTGGLSGTTATFSGQITNSIATGTAPLVITSTTLVSNLNVQYLNGQLGGYYAAASSLASYLPLAGGTLTGNLTITKAGAYLYLNGTNSDSELRFMANGSDRWAVGMNVGDATENLNIYNYTTTSTNFTILKASGNVGINQANPSYKLDVTGTGRFTGDLTSGSISSGGNITATGYVNVNSYIYSATYLQTGGNLIYPSTYGATQRLEVSNAANNAWIDGLTIAPGGNVTVYNNLIVNGITINQERATNARMYGTTTGAFGLLGVDSAGSFRWQIYGDASSHGFLDSTWGNWDIKKTINGELDLRVSSALVRVLNAGNYQNYALPLGGGAITGNSTFSASNHLTFGPNTSWGRYLRIGGDGYTAPVTTTASVVTTNGNLHLDAAKAAGMGIYLNWYGGAGGTLFGNGSGTQVGAVDGSGNASFIGTLAITGAITQNGNQVLHAGNVATYALPIGGGTLTGGLSGTTGSFSGDLSIVGQHQIRNANPTITFRDTDNRTAYIHVNGDIFYVLTAVADSGYGSWATVANSRWPMELNLSNNNATFGANVNAISFTGAGTGLTGTASSLSIGGNSANVNISNLATQQVSISLAAGSWYTIAANDANRASAKFTITDTSSGLHQAIHFYATAHYGTDSGAKISVISNTYYGGPPVSAIKIMRGSTYDGAMVQIYAMSACALTVSIYDNQQSSGWVIKSGVVSTTNPGTVAAFASLTTIAAAVDLSAAKSFSVSDEIYIGGATTQYKALHTNNYSAYSTFTGAGTFVGTTAIITDSSSGDSSVILHRYGGVNKVFSGYTGSQALFGGEAGVPTRLQAGGQYALTALANGNVGIGTTSPANKLHVEGGNAVPLYVKGGTSAWVIFERNTKQLYLNANYSDTNLYAQISPRSSDNMALSLSSREVAGDLLVSTSGNVGIGTTTATFTLNVYNNADVWHARFGSATGELRIGGQTSSGAVIQSYTPAGAVRDLYIQRDGGNVGIGTASASYKLDVTGTGRFTGDLTVTNILSSSNSGTFYTNTGSGYGSWRIGGTRNGWYGIEFDSGSNLMMNSNQVGFHRNGYGWQLWWSAGTAYCHKGDPGGGTQATILDSSNQSYAWAMNQNVTTSSTPTFALTTFTTISDYQITLNGGGTTWAGINWVDVNGSDQIWFNGQNKTFAIGGGGSNISGKKLHIDGGVTIGADYDSTTVLANGLAVQGAVQIGNYATIPIGGLGAAATQARTFEIARIGIDYNDWNNIGTFEVELHESYFSRGLKKTYNIWYGYVSNSGIRLVEWRGNGENNFQCRIGSQVLISGDSYYLPVYVDVKSYSFVDVVIKTNRIITTNSSPSIGYTYVNTAPSATNISDFTADSDLEISTLGSAKLGGNTILTTANYNSYALPLSGGTLTGALNGTTGSFSGNLKGGRVTLRDDCLEQHVDDSDGVGIFVNYFGYNSGTTRFRNFGVFNGKNQQLLYITGSTGATAITGTLGVSSAITQAGNQVLHAGNFSSYALPLTGGALTGSVLTETAASSWGVYSKTSGVANYSGIWFSSNVGELLLRNAAGSLVTRIAADGSYAFINNNNILTAANYGGYSAFSGVVSSASGGFQTATYVAGRNRIWSFGNADAYGISYFQGALDVIGLHFGVATSAGSHFQFTNGGAFNAIGAITQNGSQVLHAGNFSSYAVPYSGGTFTGPISTNVGGTSIFIGNQNVTTSNGLRINFHTDADLSYYIGKKPGAWTQPLDINFYTGIRLYASPSYDYGISFWNSNNTSKMMSVGEGDSNVRVVNTIYAAAFSGPLTGNVTGNVTGTAINIAGNGASVDPYGTIAVTEPANASNYSYYGLTRAGVIGAGFGLTGTNGALGLGANAFWFGSATSTAAGVMGSAYIAFNGSSLVAVGTVDATQFRDRDDTVYYLDPAGTSNLNKFSTFTMSYNDMNPMHIQSPYVARYNASAQYRNGTMGYGTVDCNVIFSNWGSGFIDSWGTPANGPGSSSHYVGFQSLHYNHQNSVNGYGFQMLCAGEATNRFFWRSAWATLNSWVEMIHTGNIASQTVASCTGNAANITAYTINQSVGTGNSPSFTGLSVINNITGNVTGSATSISGFNNPTTSATVNTIVYRDSGGDIYGRYLFGSYVNSSDDTGSTGLTYIMAKFGNDYHRSATADKVAAFISGQTMNINGSSTSCSGSAASAGALNTSNDYTVASLTSNGFVYSGSSAGSTGAFYFNSSSHGIRRASGTNDVYCYTTSGTLYLGAGGSSTTHVRVTSGGDVGIGVSPSYKLDVNGNVHATAFPTSSDIRFKKNITPLENSLEKIKKLQGVKYEWNEFVNSVRDGYKLNVPIIGLIAQDVEKIVPEVVDLWKLSEDCQDARSIDYPRLIPVLIEAIKEQQIIIENQNQKIENLTARMSALEAK
jgi:hypothetical protein